MKNAAAEIKRNPCDVCAVTMVVGVVNEVLSVPVFIGFGIMPLVCAASFGLCAAQFRHYPQVWISPWLRDGGEQI
jgi:hypothetical protein